MIMSEGRFSIFRQLRRAILLRIVLANFSSQKCNSTNTSFSKNHFVVVSEAAYPTWSFCWAMLRQTTNKNCMLNLIQKSECTCVVYLIMRLQTISEPSFRVGAYLRENCLLSHNAAAKLEEEAERTAEGREGGEGLSLSLSPK